MFPQLHYKQVNYNKKWNLIGNLPKALPIVGSVSWGPDPV